MAKEKDQRGAGIAFEGRYWETGTTAGRRWKQAYIYDNSGCQKILIGNTTVARNIDVFITHIKVRFAPNKC